MNSSLETDCTGMGDANNDSALVSLASSSGDSMVILLGRGWDVTLGYGLGCGLGVAWDVK